MFSKVAPSLKNNPDDYLSYVLKDEHGRAWDHVREQELIAALSKYMDENGASSEALARWAGGQAGSSWQSSPAAWKEIIMQARDVPRKHYIDKMGSTSTATELENHLKHTTLDKLRRTLIIQHAFTYHLLTTTELPQSNIETRTMKLGRTEPPARAKDIHGKNLSDMPGYSSTRDSGHDVEPKRGAAESFSAYRWVYVKASSGTAVHTVQEVPHHRIFGSYLQNRPRGSSMFAGDGENEFIVDTHGLTAKLVHRSHAEAQMKTYTPGETAARLAKLKEDWQTENRGGQAVKRTAEELPKIVRTTTFTPPEQRPVRSAPAPSAPSPVQPTGNQVPQPGYWVTTYGTPEYQALTPAQKTALNVAATAAGKAAVKLGEDAGVKIKPFGMTFSKAYAEAAKKFMKQMADAAALAPKQFDVEPGPYVAQPKQKAAKEKAAADLAAGKPKKTVLNKQNKAAQKQFATEMAEAAKKLKIEAILEGAPATPADYAAHVAQKAYDEAFQKATSAYFQGVKQLNAIAAATQAALIQQGLTPSTVKLQVAQDAARKAIGNLIKQGVTDPKVLRQQGEVAFWAAYY